MITSLYNVSFANIENVIDGFSGYRVDIWGLMDIDFHDALWCLTNLALQVSSRDKDFKVVKVRLPQKNTTRKLNTAQIT